MLASAPTHWYMLCRNSGCRGRRLDVPKYLNYNCFICRKRKQINVYVKSERVKQATTWLRSSWLSSRATKRRPYNLWHDFFVGNGSPAVPFATFALNCGTPRRRSLHFASCYTTYKNGRRNVAPTIYFMMWRGPMWASAPTTFY